jgi:hypothetical protein
MTKVSENHEGNNANTLLATVDLSWMWHCSDNPKNVLDYSELVDDSKIAKALTVAAAMGFRSAMRKMEDLNLIEMGDIDRSPKHSDQETWDASFNCG